MWVIIRVVVLLPFVPLMLITGMRRWSSVIIRGASGAIGRRPIRRPCALPARRAAAGVQLGQAQRRAGDQLGLVACLPRIGHDPVAGARSCGGWSPARAAPGAGGAAGVPRGARATTTRARRVGRTGRSQPNERMARRQARAIPGPPPADGHLDLDRGLEPVQVGSVEEPDFDEAHGRRSIWASYPTVALD